MVHIQPPMD